MGRIVTFTHVTLDGVMQAPGRPDEDTRGEFGFGGWEVRYADEVMAGVAAQGMATRSEPLPWENSTLLKGDAGESVADLKASSEQDLVVLGSGDLIETLMRHDL